MSSSRSPVPDPAAEARLAELERRVAELTARLEAPADPPAALAAPPAYDRRGLLLRGGAVLAGAAGAVALPGLAGRAAAANGDPVLLAATNEANEGATTVVGGTATEPALVLRNPRGRASYSAPTLRLTPGPGQDGLDPFASSAGDLGSAGDLLWYAHTPSGNGEASAVGAVYTSAFANHLQFVQPRRVLDTRPGGATDELGNPNDRRTRVVAGQFDSSGRLRAGTSLVLDLSALVTAGAGVFGNLTVVASAAAGFLAAYPTPAGPPQTGGFDRPAVSSLNYGRGTSALANFALVQLGDADRISIYTAAAAHVLFDVVAFSVFEPFSAGDPDGAAVRRGGALRRS